MTGDASACISKLLLGEGTLLNHMVGCDANLGYVPSKEGPTPNPVPRRTRVPSRIQVPRRSPVPRRNLRTQVGSRQSGTPESHSRRRV